MARQYIAKVSTPLPVNLGANKSLYGRDIAQAGLGAANLPPFWWQTSFTFPYGVASTKTAASMITDATGPVTVTRISGGTQNGISWNDTLKRWEYDGVIGDPGSGTWVMRASDGVNPPVDATITSTVLGVALVTPRITVIGFKEMPVLFDENAIGQSGSTRLLFGKHVNMKWNSFNNRLYVLGGDGGYPLRDSVGGDSGCIRFHTFDDQGNSLPNYYPYFGVAGQIHPAGGGCNPIAFDRTRNCYWTLGGFYEGMFKPSVNFGQPVRGGFYRFDLAGPNAGKWTEIEAHYYGHPLEDPGYQNGVFDPSRVNFYWFGPPVNEWRGQTSGNIPAGLTSGISEGHGLFYHPRTDSLIIAAGNKLQYIPLTDGHPQKYQVVNGPVIPEGTINGGPLGSSDIAYDETTDALFWYHPFINEYGGGPFLGRVDMSNFPTSCTQSVMYRGLYKWTSISGINPSAGSDPGFIRGRKFYKILPPHRWSSTNYYGNAAWEAQGGVGAGNKLGIWEVDIDSGETKSYPYPMVTQDSFPVNLDSFPSNTPWGGQRITQGAYAPSSDRFIAFPGHGNVDPPLNPSRVIVFGWEPPPATPSPVGVEPQTTAGMLWTPGSGTIRKITRDVYGSPVNSIDSVRPASNGRLGNGIILAWASACFARDVCTNGAMLINNGGDADYWGTELYCFSFDEFKWRRFNEPHDLVAQSDPDYQTWLAAHPGGASQVTVYSAQLPTDDPKYWNQTECEHGPLVPPTGACSNGDWGLLPVGTTPGVPHNYDGVMWLPGDVIGNVRGALVRPISTFCYTTRSTGRAHYLDLDWIWKKAYPREWRWGRLSVNRGGQDPLVSASAPVLGYDESLQRVYHSYGYLDLPARTQFNRTWSGLSSQTKGIFDNKRRLWLIPQLQTAADMTSTAPGVLKACAVDSNSLFVNLNLQAVVGSLWPMRQNWFAGLEYCPDLDAFFLYNQGTGGNSYADRQKIWKIQPPDTTSPATALTSAWAVSEITMGGDPVPIPNSGQQGNFGRFMWVPTLKCFAIFNGPTDTTGYVWLYKPEGI